MKKICLMMLFILVSMCLFAQNAHKPVVVVAPFDVCDKVTDKEAEQFLISFQSLLSKTKKVSVVDRNSLDKIKEQLKFQNEDWSDSEKVAELGRALNAEIVITEKINDAFDVLNLTISMIDVNTTVMISSAGKDAENAKTLYKSLAEIVQELVDGMDDNISTKPKKQTSKNDDNTATTTTVYPSNVKYKIGDRGPGGGIVFYVSEIGFTVYNSPGIYHYMECSDLISSSMTWCPFRLSQYENHGKYDNYCCKDYELSTKTDFGYGKYNTSRIINVYHRHGSVNSSNCAAYKCNQYSTSTTKAGEWWLPSKDELDYIYSNLAKNGIIPASGYFWSSSHDNNDVWYQSFSDGNQHSSFLKDFHDSVRAVRAF